MVGIDLTTVLLLIVGLVVLFLALDFLFAGGGMTGAMMGGMMHGTAAMLGSPYGWALIIALVLIVLAVIEFLLR